MRFPQLLLLGALSAPSLLLQAAPSMPAFPELGRAPGPRPTAAQVLDNAIPGRPPHVPVEERHDRSSYAPERLYSVPPIGEHPRILFSSADLPRIRSQLDATATGKRLRADATRRADVGPADGWLAQIHAALVRGEVEEVDRLWLDARNPQKAGPPGALSSPLTSLLFFRSLVGLLEERRELSLESAAAVTTYARWMRPKVEHATQRPGAYNHWLQVRGAIGDFGSLAFLYDFTQPSMSPEQIEEVRGLISLCIRDRHGLGMDLPPHWRNWNFIGMGLYFPLLALSIEGEPGFDPRIPARAREVARDYILHGNSSFGSGSEGIGYHTAGMAHVNLVALAFANRGDQLLTLDRYRRMLDSWLVWTLQPYGREWASNGDLGTFPPSAALLQMARFLFPTDSQLALVAGQAPEVTQLDRPSPEVALLQLLAPVELGTDRAASRAPAFPAGLPLSLHDTERGVLFARTGWEADDLYLQFHARSDTLYPSHDHADRGTFLLTALGQAWSVPSFRETESQHNTVVTIDGVGQGYFPTPARWTSVEQTEAFVSATVDLSYCYDWRWMKSSFLATDEQLREEPWLEVFREARDRLLSRVPRERWERDPSPAVRAYYEPVLAGDPRMWGAEDAWVLRAPYNPVRKAFRSIALVRGEHPFIVVADDIRKDDAERLYEWRMILPMQVEAHEITGNDFVIGRLTEKHLEVGRSLNSYKNVGKSIAQKGDPRLLVRILEMAGPALPEATPTPSVETIEFIKRDDVHQFAGRPLGLGRRLVLPSRSVEPRYRVLLFPHRVGDALPVTEWERPGLLRVTLGTDIRRVRFEPRSDGSTRLALD